MSLSLDTYCAACWPDRRIVLGHWLQPFSLGHALFLHRIGSPFADVPREPDCAIAEKAGLGDFLAALWVLERDHERAAHKWTGRGVQWLLKAWAWQVRLRGARWLLQEFLLMEHLAEPWRACPRAWSGNGNGKTSGAPFLLQVKATLMGALGYSEREALTLPLAQAFWEFAAWWELEDRISLISDRDSDALIKARELKGWTAEQWEAEFKGKEN